MRALGSRLYSVVKSRIRWPLKAALSLGLQPVGCETRERERERTENEIKQKERAKGNAQRDRETERTHQSNDRVDRIHPHSDPSDWLFLGREPGP